MKNFRLIYLSLITIFILVTGIIIYMIYYKSENRGCGVKNSVSIKKSNLTTNQKKGKEIFYSNCLACHKLNSKSTGPALHDVDSIVFVNWLTNKKYKIDSTKVEILAIDYHKTVFSKTLTQKDVRFLIEYCHSK